MRHGTRFVSRARQRRLARAPLALALAAVLGAAPVAGHAATLTVTDGGDSGTARTCTLRQAITSMNDASVTGACTADGSFGSNDRIEFDTGSFPTDGSATITLRQGQLVVSNADLTIDASANGNVTIDAHQASRVLKNTGVSGSALILSHLILANGNARSSKCGTFPITTGGGGVCSPDADLALQHSTVSDSSTTWGGGGIFTRDGVVTLTDSTVSGNSGFSVGGGIYTKHGDVTMTNSTVSGNSAYFGAGIYTKDGAITLTNTTISRNSANLVGAGIFILDSGTVTAWNSIIADNSGMSGEITATTVSGDHNLIGINPMLGPLADNGGPTQTMLPQPGSPAIDTGDSAHCTTTDQHDVSRPQGDGCDIGAVEVNNPSWLFSDASTYARYGQTRSWVLELSNPWGTPISGLSVEGHPPAAIDTAGMTWRCLSPPPAQCTTYGSGALNDANVTIPPHGNVLWIISAPIKQDATASTLDMRVHVSNTPGPAFDATDRDTLVIFRDGFDVDKADGTMAVP